MHGRVHIGVGVGIHILFSWRIFSWGIASTMTPFVMTPFVWGSWGSRGDTDPPLTNDHNPANCMGAWGSHEGIGRTFGRMTNSCGTCQEGSIR